MMVNNSVFPNFINCLLLCPWSVDANIAQIDEEEQKIYEFSLAFDIKLNIGFGWEFPHIAPKGLPFANGVDNRRPCIGTMSAE